MRRLPAVLAILAGALLLLWPALLNHYPILFSDTGAFLAQSTVPLMIWDKPWIYGPLLHLFHWEQTLWLPAIAQVVVVSHLLWLVQRELRGAASWTAHLLLTGGLAALTALPWVASLLMPDFFSGLLPLGFFLLGYGRLSRGEWAYVTALMALGIPAHLSNIPTALALVVMVGLLRLAWRPLARAAAPLLIALGLLAGSNWIGHGQASLSPYGSTFLLARMIGDGPAARTIAARCPDAGWYLCAWAGRLPEDSDVFLWERFSPMNRDAAGQDIFLGGVRLAPEARAIIAETLSREPWAVARAAAGNALRQVFLVEIGDTLSRHALGDSVRPRLVEFFPAAEVARHDGSLQFADRLPGVAAAFLWPQPVVLMLGLAGLLWALRRPGGRLRLGFVLLVLVGVMGNAVATGALSKPHHRYQARVAWLLPFGAALLLLPGVPPRHPGRQHG
ncbi:hypothetical protein [Teichococcus deserti]|nr:hypothetical protein [Pseudoroseomonas deserti]